MGNSRWYDVAPNLRPEAGLLAIRKGLNLFANIRPAYLYEELAEACPLKKEIIGDGFDMVIMRELTGGLYFGERKTVVENGVTTAVDTLTYNENEIRRIAVKAFDIAMKEIKRSQAWTKPCTGFIKTLEKGSGRGGKGLSGGGTGTHAGG